MKLESQILKDFIHRSIKNHAAKYNLQKLWVLFGRCKAIQNTEWTEIPSVSIQSVAEIL